jgi:O-antigen/teichoic acid export membrane protein
LLKEFWGRRRRPPAEGPRKQASVRRNVGTNYLVQVTLVLVGFLTTPLLTHELGIVRFGVWALIGSLIPYLELLELGFASATIAFVTKHLELDDDEKVHATLNTSFLILAMLGCLAFVIVVVAAVFLPDLITSIPKDLVNQARVLLLLLAFDMAISIPMDTFGGALCALQRYDLLNFSQIAVSLSQAAGWVVVLSLHGGLVALGIVTVAVSLVGQLVRMAMLHHLLPAFRLSPRQFDRGMIRSFTVISGWYSLQEVSFAVIGGADVLIVGAAAGIRSAAVYSVGQRLGQLPVKIVEPRVNLLFTQTGTLATRGDHEGMAQAVTQITRTVQAISIPSALILGFLAGPTVRAWVGPEYHKAALIIALLCIAGCVQSWALTLRTALNGWGQPKVSSVLLGIEAALHVGLGIVLAEKYGAVGMAVAVLISVVAIEATLMLPIAYRRLGISMWAATLSAIRALALPALVGGGIAWVVAGGGGFLGNFAASHSKVAGLAAVAGVGIWLLVVFACLFFLTGLRPVERDRFAVWARTRLGGSRAP